MKRSSLVIVFMVLVSFAFIAAVPITFLSKLRNGSFVRTISSQDFPVERKKMSNVSVISLRGLSCEFIQADSFSIEIEKDKEVYALRQMADTLSIVSDSPGLRVRVFSRDLTVIANKCDILVKGNFDPLHIASYQFDVDSCQMTTRSISSDHRIRQHVRNIYITGNTTSSVAFAGSISIDTLSLRDIAAIDLDESLVALDLEVEYATPVAVKSVSHDGAVSVSVKR